MRDFAYAIADRVEDAFAADGREVMAIAGGTELLNWFRLGVAAPSQVVDLGRLPGLGEIRREGDQLVIGALSTLNEVGEHPEVRAHARALSQACLAAASPQVRNRATLGGNVLQKTRCAYFRAEQPLPWPCNKREPGRGCAARNGLNERHALFGWTDDCVAVHPSDPVNALALLDAVAELIGPEGPRRLPVADLLLTQAEAAEMLGGSQPGAAATLENRLKPGEVILDYHLPVREGWRSAYVKVRERASYEYALVSAAAAVRLEGDRIAEARVVLGSVAQKPWRLAAAEASLAGLAATETAALPVLKAAFGEARPLDRNRYKIAMAAGAAARAIAEAGAAA